MKKLLILLVLFLCSPVIAAELKVEGFYFPTTPFAIAPKFDHLMLDGKNRGWLFIGTRRYEVGCKSGPGGHFQFKTETVHGTWLSFSGKYLMLVDLQKVQPSTPVLEGILTIHSPEGPKQEKVRFNYFAGD